MTRKHKILVLNFLIKLCRKLHFTNLVYYFSVKCYDIDKVKIWKEIDQIQHPWLYKNGKKIKELETNND